MEPVFFSFTSAFMTSMRPVRFLLALLALLPIRVLAQQLPLISSERIEEISGWLPAEPGASIPPFVDREFWSRVGTYESAPRLLREADRIAGQPMPVLTENMFNEFRLTGKRSEFDTARADRLRYLRIRVLAEGIENQGRYLPEIEETITAILNEPSWINSAHARKRKTWADTYDLVDLNAAALVWELAMSDWLLGDSLAPETRRRIREEAEARVFKPYRERIRSRDALDFTWMIDDSNWNSVCNAGVLGAALILLDSPFDRAEFAAAFEAYSQYYIAGFGDDGSCKEGMGYWVFGFGHFLAGAEALREATGGRLDLLEDPKIERIAGFGFHMEIVDGVYPAFGDAQPDKDVPQPWLLDFAALHYGVGTVQSQASLTNWRMYLSAFDLMFPRKENASGPVENTMALRDWFPDAEILIARQTAVGTGLSVAIKGGNNVGSHNHNDIGSYVVVNGHDVVLTDLGADVPYVKGYFGPKRYDSGMANSFGHPVPRVAGVLQSPGGQARARILRREFSDTTDVLELDMTSAYDTEQLVELLREFRFSRGDGGCLEIEDRVVFESPQSFDTAVVLRPGQSITPIPGEGPGCFRVTALNGEEAVDIHCSSPDSEPLVFTQEPVMGFDPAVGAKGLRLGIGFSGPVLEGTIRVRITPSSSAVKQEKKAKDERAS